MKPKTHAQIQRIFGLAKKQGFEMDEDGKAAIAITASLGRTDSLSQLSFQEANVAIKKLGGQPVSLEAVSRRTENHRKQQAGVVTMASQKALHYMDKLAEERGMTPQGLERLCMRMFKSKRPRTARACSAVIEALKSMNTRTKKEAA